MIDRLVRHLHLAPTDRPALLSTLAALALLLIPYALLSAPGVVATLRRRVDGRPAMALALAALFLFPYLLYWGVAGKATPGALAGALAYVAAPALLAVGLPLARRRSVGDALVILAIWLPHEWRWIRGSFPWPPGGAAHLLGVLLGLDLLLYLMLVVRRFDGLGYSFRIRRRDVATVLLAFVAIAAVCIPIGLGTGFLAPVREPHGPLAAVAATVAIFLFTAVPEETLFRGFIQGLLERWTARPAVSLAAGSLLFGAAHLNNGPAADWRYFVLASLAGVAYGWTYQRTGRIAAPALLHSLIDASWVLFLRK